MSFKQFATEYEMGVDLRGQDYAKAAVREIKDAFDRNSLTVAHVLAREPEEIVIRCTVAVAGP